MPRLAPAPAHSGPLRPRWSPGYCRRVCRRRRSRRRNRGKRRSRRRRMRRRGETDPPVTLGADQQRVDPLVNLEAGL